MQNNKTKPLFNSPINLSKSTNILLIKLYNYVLDIMLLVQVNKKLQFIFFIENNFFFQSYILKRTIWSKFLTRATKF